MICLKKGEQEEGKMAVMSYRETKLSDYLNVESGKKLCEKQDVVYSA